MSGFSALPPKLRLLGPSSGITDLDQAGGSRAGARMSAVGAELPVSGRVSFDCRMPLTGPWGRERATARSGGEPSLPGCGVPHLAGGYS